MHGLKLKIYFTSFLFLVCTNRLGLSQNITYKSINYTTDNGLESNTVYQTFIDSKGYLWVATEDGVNKFDGQKIISFNKSNGLLNNTVFKIFEDDKHRIWFLPISCKLSYFDGNKIIPYKHNKIINKYFQNAINADLQFGKDYIDFMENGEGVLRIYNNGKVKKTKSYKGSCKGCRFLVQSTNKRLTISSKREPSSNFQVIIKFIDKSNKRIITLPKLPLKSLKNDRFGKLRFSKNILYTNDTSLYEINSTRYSCIKTFNSSIINLFIDKKDGIWIATLKGCYYKKNGSKKWQKLLGGLAISSICMDNDNGYWIGTLKNGIYHLPDIESYILTKDLEFSNDNIVKFSSDGKHLYAAADQSVIYKISKEDKVISHISFDHIQKDNYINNLFFNQENKHLYVGGSRGGIIINDKFIENRNLDAANYITNFNKWVVTGHWRYMRFLGDRKDNFDSRSFTPKERSIRFDALCKKSTHEIYVGSVDGLYVYDDRKRSLNKMNITGLKKDIRVIDIDTLTENRFLISTKEEGVFILKNNQILGKITDKDGLLSNNIKKSIATNGVLWISTNKGLSKVEVDKSYAIERLSNYTNKNLLLSNEINDIILFQDKIYIATSNGISVLPVKNYQNRAHKKLHFSKINIARKDTTLQSIYDLDYFQNDLEIHFNTITYQNASDLKYRYKLVGINDKWRTTTNTNVNLLSLPPGDYKFVCQALLNNKIYSSVGIIYINIQPPFWKKWWFLILVFIVGSIVMYKLTEWTILINQKRKNKKNELTRLITELELKALRSQINPHFIFNVIFSIQHYILFNQKEDAQKYLGKFAKLLRNILSHSDVSHIYLQEDIESLILYLDLEVMRFEEKFTYTIHIQEGLKTESVKIPPMLVQPIVENAIKHGFSNKNIKGVLTINIEANEESIIFTVTDNGVGRKKAQEIKQKSSAEHKSMGMNITQDRLKAIGELFHLNTKLEIIDLEDANKNALGTKVIIEVPYQKPTNT